MSPCDHANKKMPLERPKEKHWNFRQPSEEVYPRNPTRWLFLGPSGSGKTTTIIALLLGPYKHSFDALHIFTPSGELDSAWDPIRKHIKTLKREGGIHTEWDESQLRQIMQDQMSLIKEEKSDTKRTKPLSSICVIIDDHADNPAVFRNASNIITTLMVRGRHAGVSTWLSSQKLRALGNISRVNLQAMCIWRLRNYKEIEALLEELSALYDKKVLREMYELATGKKYGFWSILLTNEKSRMFLADFDEYLVNDGFDSAPGGGDIGKG